MVLSVRDDGPGIAKKVLQERLFELFTTRSEGTTRVWPLLDKVYNQWEVMCRLTHRLDAGTEFVTWPQKQRRLMQ
ncbi:MAG: hypothetical protein IPP22_15435 [Nitrosomonas sp.]|nr:hypothetical protein [Nitrosomonas sp.]